MLNYYDVNRLSNTRMGYFDTNPAVYYSKVILNNKDDEYLDNKSLENGKLVHLYIEDPKSFVIADVNKIDGLLGNFIEYKASGKSDEDSYKLSGFKISLESVIDKFNKPEAQSYFEYLKYPKDTIVLSSSQKNTISNCIMSIHKNDTVHKFLLGNELFCEYFNELDIYWEYILGDFTIGCKSRLDRVIIDHSERKIKIVDAKTTSGSCTGDIIKINNTGNIKADYYYTGFFYNFMKYNMYRQAAFYVQALKKHIITNLTKDINDYEIEFYYVPIETLYNNDCCVYKVSNEILQYGDKVIESIISDLKQCLNNNIWKRKNLEQVIVI